MGRNSIRYPANIAFRCPLKIAVLPTNSALLVRLNNKSPYCNNSFLLSSKSLLKTSLSNTISPS